MIRRIIVKLFAGSPIKTAVPMITLAILLGLSFAFKDGTDWYWYDIFLVVLMIIIVIISFWYLDKWPVPDDENP